MAGRLRDFFRGNFLVCVGVVCAWFIYAALRDGVSIHNHFLGLSTNLRGPHAYPPWIVTMAVEGVLLAWYFLPAAAYRRPVRWVAALFGLLGLILLLVEPAVHSRAIMLSLELIVAVYVLRPTWDTQFSGPPRRISADCCAFRGLFRLNQFPQGCSVPQNRLV